MDGDPELLQELRRLRDHEEIRQLMYRYARGVDRSDLDLLCSVYHDGGTDHHGHFDGPGEQFAEQLVESDRSVGSAVGNHHITNVLIDVDGDQARVETYFLAIHPYRDRDTTRLGLISGRYVDLLERRDHRWGICRREVISDWTRDDVSGPVWTTTTPDGGYLPGRRGLADPSYELLSDQEGWSQEGDDCADRGAGGNRWL
jgi:hypothetical protein